MSEERIAQQLENISRSLDHLRGDPSLREKAARMMVEIQKLLQQVQPTADNQSLLSTLIDVMPVGVLMANAKGEIVLANPAAMDMFPGGVAGNLNQLPGRFEYFKVDGSRLPHEQIPLTRALLEGETVRAEELVLHAQDGSERVFLINASPIFDDQDKISGAVGVFQDISRLKEQEQHSLNLETAQQRDRELLQGIFETIPGALVVLSGADYVIHYANPAFRALIPNLEIDPHGLPIEQVWSQSDGFIGTALIDQVRETGQSLRLDHFAYLQIGRYQRFLSIHVRKLDWGDEPGILISIWDTTSLDQAQSQLMRSADEAQRRAYELDTLINSIPEAVLIYDLHGNVVRANPVVPDTLGFDPSDMSIYDVTRKLNAGDRAGKPFEMPVERALRGEAVVNQPVNFTHSDGHQVTALVSSSPMYMETRIVGAVSVWRDVTEMNRRNRELETLVQVAAALRDANTQEDMIPLVLDQVVNLLAVDGAMVVMPDPATGENVVISGRGIWGSLTPFRIPPGEGISGSVMESGDVYLNNNIHSDPRLIPELFVDDIKSGACVPLKTQQRAFGALWIGKRESISQDDLRLLTAISDITANAMHRATLFDQTTKRLNQLASLHSIDMAITSSMDLQFTLSVVLDQITTHLGVDAVDILLLEPALHVLEYAAGRGFNTENKTLEYHLGEGFAGQVALERMPLIIPDISQHPTPNGKRLCRQGENFVAYFASPLIAKGQVRGVLECFHRQTFYPDPDWLDFFETLSTQTAIALDSAELFARLQHTNDELNLAYDATIQGWSRALELRDFETHGHSERVTQLAVRLARRLGIGDEDIRHYRYGVLLHDIGKMAIPDDVLLKPGPLTDEEWEIMRRHPMYAYELLLPIPYLRQSLDIPYCHHEWWDGSGYPRGLKGDEIPLSARIFAVVDVWDALRSDRPYRSAWKAKRTIDYIREHSETHFDPRVVEAFIQLVQEKE